MARRSDAAQRPRTAKSALRRELGRARTELARKSPLRDPSVHEARKALKRARSALRLLRDAIGDTAYRRANRRLRDAARPLSRVRDAKVLLEVAEKLCTETEKRSRREELGSLERDLHRERQRVRRDVLKRTPGLRGVRRSIVAVLSDSRSWRAPNQDALCRGVERIYRKGRKAFAHAEDDGREESLHESRKQTKYLGKALEMLAPTQGRSIAKRVKRANSITDALGDEHDLAMLRWKLEARVGSNASHRPLVADIERRRGKLRRKAIKRSRRFYRRKAKAFVDALDLGRRREG